MGQNLNTMNHPHQQQQSKDELLYEHVCSGDVEAIKALCRDGVNLEWFDSEGKTPLIVACMNPGLVHVAKTLIEMGANVNAYRPGRNAGTPLHHAAKRGLEQTVKLLLSYGANALLRNDDCQTALDIARIKGHTCVVRAIERHICYFSGWLREFYGPGFLEVLAPQLLSRQIWVVITPCGSGKSVQAPKFELAIYSTLQDAQPRVVIALWKAKIKEPEFHQSDPALSIFDQSTRTRFKLASANEGDKPQFYQLCNACKGIRQVMPSPPSYDAQTSISVTVCQADAVSNANGWENSANVDNQNGGPVATGTRCSEAGSSGWMDEPAKQDYNGWGASHSRSSANPNERFQSLAKDYNGWGVPHSKSSGNPSEQVQSLPKEYNGWGVPHSRSSGNPSEQFESLAKDYNGWDMPASRPAGNPIQEVHTVAKDYDGWSAPDSKPSGNPSQQVQNLANTPSMVQTSSEITSVSSAPSAPPIPQELLEEGPINYPSIDSSLVDLSVPIEHGPSVTRDANDGGGSSCIICWEAPVEGALVPCGHMAGCMSCLNEIKAKEGVCPICRAKMDQVIRVYTV